VSLRLELYASDHVEQVRRFNARLREGNVDPSFLLPESAPTQYPPDPLHHMPSVNFSKRHFLALQDESVLGGFLLQEQACEVAGETHWCGNIQMPISEGIVNRKFSYVAALMLQSLLRHRPFVFAVGMGGLEAPFAQFLCAMKWRVGLVPFRFYVLRPAQFLREVQMFNSSRSRALVANIGIWSGLGSLSLLGLQRARSQSTMALFAEHIYQWGDQSSWLWSRYRPECSFAAVRDLASLPSFLDLTGSRLSGYRLADRQGTTRGWIVLQVTAMHDNKYFGSLRIATLLDAVCEPGFERAVIRAGIACASDHNADLVITNQQHCLWVTASDENGFWKGPSNYVFATSPQLTQAISQVDPEFSRVHLSRADGDGRLNL